MIQPIETPEAQASAKASAKPAAEKAVAGGNSFAAALHKASATGETSRASAVGGPPTVRDHGHDGHYGQVHAPEGETWKPVRGDDAYAHIVSGPRKGMLINLSHGARRGEVFRVEERNGVRVARGGELGRGGEHGGGRCHVKGEGKDEKVVPASKDSGRVNRHDHGDAELRAARKRPPGETWAPVPGHSGCVDILSGPRNGYYLNTSGNERDGMVFHMVFRHGREYHIYGTGKDREVILVRHPNGNPLRPHNRSGTSVASATGGASPS